VQGALLTKRLDFKTQSQVAVAATLLSGVAGVTMALKGFGIWSLAAQSVVANLTRVLLFWRLSPWRPVPAFSLDSLKSMFPYGSRLLCAGLLNTIFDNIYLMLIGFRYSKADLGFYTRALSTQRFPISLITGIFSQVAFPALASIHDDRPRLKSAYRNLIIFSGFLTFPLMLGLLAVARPFFLLVFTEKWAPAIVYFKIFCLAGLFFPMQALNLSVLMAVGRSNLFFRLELVKKAVILAALLATVRFGILAMVWGQFVSSVVCLVVNTHYSGVTIGLSPARAVARYVAQPAAGRRHGGGGLCRRVGRRRRLGRRRQSLAPVPDPNPARSFLLPSPAARSCGWSRSSN